MWAQCLHVRWSCNIVSKPSHLPTTTNGLSGSTMTATVNENRGVEHKGAARRHPGKQLPPFLSRLKADPTCATWLAPISFIYKMASCVDTVAPLICLAGPHTTFLRPFKALPLLAVIISIDSSSTECHF
jgi:hypothetical protein